MVRKKAIIHLIWQALLFILGYAFFKTIWVPIIVLYIIRAVMFTAGSSQEPVPGDSEPKVEYVSEKVFIFGEIFKAALTILLPLIPAYIIMWIFPDFEWASGIVAIVVLLHMLVKPIILDVVGAFTNSEKTIKGTRKLANLVTVAVIGLTALQVLLYVVFPSLNPYAPNKFDHEGIWKNYVAEHNLDEKYVTYIEGETPVFLHNTKNTKSRIRKVSETVEESGFIKESTFVINYEKNIKTKKWSVSDYSFTEEVTEKLAKDTTWTGKNGKYQYTLTLVAGPIYKTSGHLTVKEDEEVVLDTNLVCTRTSENGNEYKFKTDESLGWGNYIIRATWNEEDLSFTFDSVYEGTINKAD